MHDVVICHGDFFNLEGVYTHKKGNIPFGAYGDMKQRHRMMYLAPTPFALLDGLAGQVTLIVPADELPEGETPAGMSAVGQIERVEVAELISGFEVDFETGTSLKLAPNPNAGRVHRFLCFRAGEGSGEQVSLADSDVVTAQLDLF